MNELVVLVDFENVQKHDLARFPAHARIRIFIGAQQPKLPTALVLQAQRLGMSIEWIQIEGNGPNALDFHIACHLGEGISKVPRAELVILSNDKGFDPLVRHLVARGIKCRRDRQARSTPAPKLQLPMHAQAVADLLRRPEKNKRPTKRATLTNYLATHFHKKLTGEEIKQAVEHLLEAGLIAGTEAAVTYNF